jgi:transposase
MALPAVSVGQVLELGIDDFSFRRGRNFGTILVDMQSHQTIDLLPDRKKETAAAWMSAHPEIDAGRVEIAAATMLLRQPVVLPKLSSVRTGSTC